jgi:hypothetical protein
METMKRTRRTVSPERWRKALLRAEAEGLRLYRVAGSGEVVVTSSRLNDTVYATDGLVCDCEAAMLGGDPICKHRAIFWFEQGKLNLDVSIVPNVLSIAAHGWPIAGSDRSCDRIAPGPERRAA